MEPWVAACSTHRGSLRYMWSQPTLPAQVNGSRLKGSPFKPRFVPGPVTGRCCTASGVGLYDGVTGRPCEFKLQARDSFGNACRGGGGQFKMVVSMLTPACAEVRTGGPAAQAVTVRSGGCNRT